MVQLIILVGLITAMVSVLYVQHSPPNQGLLTTIQSPKISSSKNNSNLSQLKTTKIQKPLKKPLPPPLSLTKTTPPTKPKAKTADRLPAKPLAKNLKQKSSTPSHKPTTIHIRFAEVSHSVLNEAVFKAHTLEDDIYLRAGAYPFQERLSAITKQIAGLSFLPGTRSRKLPIPFDDPMSFQFTHLDGEEYGLQLRLYPQLSNNELSIDLEGLIHLRSASNETTINTPLQSSYTILKSQVLVIELSLPTTPINESDMSSFSGTPLSIMSRTDFLDGQTSLAILIQIR